MSRRIALVVCGLALTLADGVIHGRITYRWTGVSESRARAIRQLGNIPTPCGDWETVASQPLDSYVAGILQCDASVSRRYVHRQTGEAVRVVLIMGPFGPTSTHTPDMCYTTQNFTIREQPHRVSIPQAGGGNAELWSITVEAPEVQQQTQRVYYGWSDGEAWTAPNQPRVAYGGRPYLYKIQASAEVPPDASRDTPDPCRAFLGSFLPQIQPYLVRAQLQDPS